MQADDLARDPRALRLFTEAKLDISAACISMSASRCYDDEHRLRKRRCVTRHSLTLAGHAANISTCSTTLYMPAAALPSPVSVTVESSSVH